MNTPAHVVLNGLVLGRGRWRDAWFPVTAGAVMPDLPMVGFYIVQRLVLGSSEQHIWSQAYFEPQWQAFFDVFNSLPLIALAALVAWRARSPACLVFFLSMGLHCLCDLPLHNEDAHAHFFPLSSWHFRSPVSYWDPQRHGLPFAVVEALLVLGGSLVLVLRSRSLPWRVIGAVTLALYVAFWIFVLIVWAQMSPAV